MSTVNVNLARKWRSRNFDQVIGQELSLRILKNSLYLNHYFPVYLFSGQHGCGKTTTARIFASAVNCEQLDLFQQDPKKYSIPCLECRSCRAMSAGNHPDFIEIDGASHTGVDNVRHIIDVSAFLPLMGRKKIYLIDEAHMLSKAAFNAFLKILEEPPASVLFMLATTELHKIIDTVQSRSFHLFFRSVASDVLLKHLEAVCTEEHINYDQQGLLVIIKQTKGSVRDALNLLEQVRFESNRITKKTVLKILDHTDDETLIALFEHVVFGKPGELLQFIDDSNLNSFCAETVWKSLTELINACIWIIYDLAPRNFVEYHEQLAKIATYQKVDYFNECLQLLYKHELAFNKTGSRWQLLEMLLLDMCCLTASSSERTQLGTSAGVTKVLQKSTPDSFVAPVRKPVVQQSNEKVNIEVDNKHIIWQSFIAQIERFDPLLSSIFKQGQYAGYDAAKNTITLLFAKDFVFFNEMLESSKATWMPLLTSLMGKEVIFTPLFQEIENKPKQTINKIESFTQELPQQKKSEPSVMAFKRDIKKPIEKNLVPERAIDTSDKEQWKKATILKTIFSGTIRELQEGRDE